ncbi:hypothetical protein Pcinc_002988 [Petrolisthes cinctipes]|uniref:Uncharacterized protein n=1 Tax=Petrolisthes cinctipes TaxID=88211 RepID=A0AAE1L519_PETCI|nr:hypothetical protein Pcinc_002988 [Petrolisthes cinctipes]
MWTTLYSGALQTGERFNTHDYQPDLATLGFDDKTTSVCAAGIWILYEHHDYNSGGFGAITPVVSDSGCIDLPTDMVGKVSSVRQAGSPSDPARSSLTLYSYTNYRSTEFYMTRDWPNLGAFNDEAYSAILTGSQPWTVYTYENYQGSGTCLQPEQEVMVDGELVGVGLFPTYSELGSSGSIRSVRQGCD